MTTSPPEGGDTPIKTRQNEPEFLAMRSAARRANDRAGRIRAIRATGTIGLAVTAPLLVIVWPDASTALAVMAALWIVIGRTVLDTWYQKQSLRAARAQELYDTSLFRLPWNTGLTGSRKAAVEDVATLRGDATDDRNKDWYEHVPTVPWPLDVLACQEQNLIFARRNHRAYGKALRVAVAVVITGAVGLALAKDLSVNAFLVQLFVPLAPALLDLVELPRQHETAARFLEDTEADIDELWSRHTEGEALTAADCRSVQNSIWNSRITAPRVPSLLHRHGYNINSAANAARMQTIQEKFARNP
ncbi:S-4TM family putative pore-forming effector [Streptomyces sp. NPDC051041]|uniref:S-4TM family putative pore-forming effector n=1 Tax=Streptomyces sp. NPDC051041 TaxID=3365640 RepID=UPI00379FCD0C